MQPDIGKYQVSASGAGAIIARGEAQPGEVEVDETKAFINNLFSEGKYEEAGPHLEAIVKTAEAAKDLGKKAWSLHQMGIRAFCMGNKAGARGFWKESLKIRKSLKDVNGTAVTNYHLRLIRPSLPLIQRIVDRIGEIGARVLIPLGVVVMALLFAPVMSNRTAPPQPVAVSTPSPSPSPVQENAGSVTIPVVTPQPLASPTATHSAPTPGAASSASPAPATPAPVAPTSAPAPATGINISPGRVHFTGPGEQVVTLTNKGAVAITNLKVNWVNNPGVFKASLDCSDLKAGQQCRLRIGYSGSAAPSSAALNLVYDGGEITMPMGPGSHGMSRAPDRLAFADQAVNGGGITQSVTITNKSTAEVEVREISVPGRIFFRKPHFTASQDCERKIAPGATCDIKVTFAPTEVGPQKTELRIKVRPAGGGEALPLPPVALVGKGVR